MKKEKEKEKVTNMQKEKKIKNKKDKIATFNLIEVIDKIKDMGLKFRDED